MTSMSNLVQGTTTDETDIQIGIINNNGWILSNFTSLKYRFLFQF